MEGVLALALVAGAVAAFNPCGFALLPAYLALIVAGESERPAGRSSAVVRGLRLAAGMTLGFVAVFGIFGVLVAPLRLSVERYLPVVTLVVGIALVAVGIYLLLGGHLVVRGLSGRGSAPTAGFGSQVGYGVAFALASLSCTIGPFLAATSVSLSSSGVVGVVATFVAYALGMGTVIAVLAVVAASAGASAVRTLRRVGSVLERVSGLLVLASGVYVAWYGWFELRVLGGERVDDPVVDAAIKLQSSLSRAVAGLGTTTLLVLAAALIAVALVALLRRRTAETKTAAETVER